MREKLYSLKKARIRQSWNKYNFYNLMRQRPLRIEGRTYFQQKYAAKQETRRYHGEHLTKRQWQNIFRHSLHSVVPMNVRVLAGNDGSEQAMGRGSGLDLLSPGRGGGGGVGRGRVGDVGLGGGGLQVLKVPYMNQMWAPMERRLDMAVFRAMFASSARQARQFVVHGFVCVNGKRMKHPGYMLNPGDMFSVEPEQVLFATGKSKDYLQVKRKVKDYVARKEGGGEGEAAEKEESTEGKEAEAEAKEPESPDATVDTATNTTGATTSTNTTPADLQSPDPTSTSTPDSKPKPNESGADSESGLDSESPTNPDTTTTTTTTTTPADLQSPDPTSTSTSTTTPESKPKPEKTDPHNPLDPSKPYLTPWQPRDYLSPFAFIPRYLEVNFTICHAVYLRHPVARPGATEVPSPFGPDTQQLAFHWFLRRR
ncbi:hypothetical protein BGX38DRAFT_1144877 [Terfezia claveryi]|nr:hypothetical protein BGX38DRAFT_1144877 [Terfezia claveryi]